ncbi:hypothetical protein EON65_23735 [archaeon]|nr:MAG: hypothetical protein EON65_23735 [archaeon]
MAEELTNDLINAEESQFVSAKEIGLRQPLYSLLEVMFNNVAEEEDVMLKADLHGDTKSDQPRSSALTPLTAHYDKYDIQSYKEADYIQVLYELQQKRPVELTKEELALLSLQHAEGMISSEMIKTGKYGPDIDEFSMPLPSTFPMSAGKARYALHNAIVRYATTVHKLESEQLPTTLEEVYVPTLKERSVALYHCLNRTNQRNYRNSVKEFFVIEAKRRQLEDNVYMGARRQTFLSLPGLTRHYPNPNYPEAAVLLPGSDFARPQRVRATFVDRFLGRKVVKSIVSPPVGRKPKHLCGLSALRWQGEQSGPRSYGAESFKYMLDKVDYDADVLGNLMVHDDNEPKSKWFLNLSGSGNKTQKKKKKQKRKQKIFDVLKGNYPRTFYTGRRGSYPNPPGLQDFVIEHHSLQSNSIANSRQVMEDVEAVQPVGLVRRFYIQGLELAHHGAVNDMVFAPSEARLVSAGGDGLIKIWDPRDGSFVRSLQGHKGEVRCVQYTKNEQFLVSCGADSQILIWSLLTRTIQRKLKGHVDVVNSIAIAGDCSIILSASHDGTIKSWYTTPRHPATPAPPRIVSVAHDSIMINWTAPPCFNLDITAFHIQYRVGIREAWVPKVSTNILLPASHYEISTDDRAGLCIAPHIRTKTINYLIPATYYQFRVRAENRMGLSDWSQPSPLTRTEFGLPEAPEKPLIVSVGIDYVQLMWFTPNPDTFGSAAMSFHVQCQGKDLCFNDREPREKMDKFKSKVRIEEEDFIDSTIVYSLEEVKDEGLRVLQALNKIEQRFERSKKKLKKSEVFSVLNRQSPEEEKELPISRELPNENLFESLARSKLQAHILVSAKYKNLHPGFLYGFRVRGINQVGRGSWSATTLTISTLPTLPCVPDRPVLKSSTLRSLTVQWNPPQDDGGSAITGYTINLINTDKYIDLGRSTVQFTWEGLFPGKSYRLRVAAKNMVGQSDFSEPNSVEHSYTSIAPPEMPTTAPVAVEGSWNELTYEVAVPYSNGAKIDHMIVQQRLITAFSVGNWEVTPNKPIFRLSHLLYKEEVLVKTKTSRLGTHRSASVQNIETKLPNKEDDLEVIEFIDTDQQQIELEETVAKLELMKSAAGFNPYSGDRAKLDAEIEALITTQKPSGSRLRFRLLQLQPDSMYEVRVAFVNSAGQGVFSMSSHRAKTNQASAPAACAVPSVVRLGPKYMVLDVTVPSEGGAPVRFFHIECMDLDDSNTLKLRYSRNALDLDTAVQYRIENLRPGGSYLVRCCAESSVGTGAFSPWSKEIELMAPHQASAIVTNST